MRLKIVALAFAAGAIGAVVGNALWSAGRTAFAERQAAQEAQSPAGQHRDAVRQRLIDPESAQFRNVIASKRSPWAFCGEVNARNRMGGMVGFRRYVAALEADRAKNWGDRIVIDSDDDRKTFKDISQHEELEGAWRTYCE